MSTFSTSAVTADRTGSTPPVQPPPAAEGLEAIPFVRLCTVELRKQLDTRAGIWLLIVIAVVNTAFIVLTLTTADSAHLTWSSLTEAASLGQVLLLPLIGVMAATSEWSQRTALTTFVLEPRRTRVNLAKLVSAGILGLIVMALTILAGAVLNVVGLVWLGGDGSWALNGPALAGTALALLLLVAQGVAFGLAFLSTPVAIVAYLALPTLWSILTTFIAGLSGPATWLDMNRTLLPLMAGEMTMDDYPRLAVSVAVWVGLRLTLGIWRIARRDIA